jgi:hypothetical protein
VVHSILPARMSFIACRTSGRLDLAVPSGK